MKALFILKLLFALMVSQVKKIRLLFELKKNHESLFLIKTLSILILLGLSMPINAQWVEKNNGLNGGIVRSSVVSSDGTTIFVGLPTEGVFKSTDNGGSWSEANTGIENSSVEALTVIGNSIFVGMNGGDGVYRSINNGLSWQQVGLSGISVHSLGVVGTDIYAGTFSGLYKSTDDGTNWNAVNNGINGTVNAIIGTGSFVFVGTSEGVFRSSDSGASWTQVSNGMPSSSITILSLAFLGSDLYAGSYNSGILKSTDNGVNWTSVNSGITTPSTNWVFSLAVSGTKIYAGSFYGLFSSTDNGSNWTEDNGLLNSNVNTLEVAGSDIYAGTEGGGMYKTTDNGSTWNIVNNGLTNVNVNFLTNDGSDIYAGTEGAGVFRSTDNTNTWSSLNNGITNPNVRAFVAVGPNLLVGTPDGVFLSSDNGGSWSLTELSGIDVYSLAIPEVNSNEVYAASTTGVYKSTNNGVNWVGASSGLSNTNVNYVVANSTNIYASTLTGIFRSTDSGSSWTAVNSGLTDTQVIFLALKGSSIFASTYSSTFISTDEGNSWTAVNALPDGHISYSIYVNGDDIYTPASNSVFISPDNGSNWSRPPDVSFPLVSFTSLVFSSTQIFASTINRGVYSRALSEFQTPTISSFTPTSGVESDTISISGTNFTDATAVSFGGTPAASFSIIDEFTIDALVGPGTTGDVSVTTPGGTTTLSGFTYAVPPTISSFAPASAGTGETVTINGSKFTGATDVYFGGTPATSFSILDDLTIQAVVGNGSSGDISVVTSDGTASRSGFTYIQLPTITSFTPPSGAIGTTVSISGTNFSENANDHTVKFNGVASSVISATIDTVGYQLNTAEVDSYMHFVDFSGANAANNLLSYGSNANETTIEIRFGSGVGQKAHRFAPGNIYLDYVDVPFEVWDVTNNRQLMAVFRDQQEDGAYNLIPFNTDGDASTHSREYIWVSDVLYDAVNPDPNIAINDGQNFNNMYFIWPYLDSNSTWDPNNLPNSKIEIHYDGTITGLLTANVPTGASTGPITVELGGATATSSTDFIVLPQSFASLPYNPSDGGDFESNQSDWQVEHTSGTSFELGNSSIPGKDGTSSGSFAWVTGLNEATYQDNSRSALVSPSFDFSSSTEFKLEFKSKFQFEDTWDGFIVQYSVAGGAWQTLNNELAPGWYNTLSDPNSIFGNTVPMFSGSTNAVFESFETDLSFLSGNSDVRFKFEFLSDDSATDIGMALDDFSIVPASGIKTFSFNTQLGESSIGGGVVNITVPSGTDVASLIPTFTLTTGATATVNGNTQTSGSTALDFTNPVLYTVTSGSATQDWLVTVTLSTPYAHYAFSNNFLDESGAHNGTELTANNAFIENRLGFANAAFQFNNNVSSPTIELQNTANADFGDEITVSAWIKPESYDVDVIQLLANQQGGIGIDFNLVTSDLPIGEQSYKRRLYAGITGISFGSFGEVLLDRWTHVAFRYIRNVGVTLFINGVNQGTYGFIAGKEDSPIPISAEALFLGKDFHGKMDEVKIFDSALSDQDIYDQFNLNRWPFHLLAFRGPEGGNAFDWPLELNQVGDSYKEALLISDPGNYQFRATGTDYEVFMGDNEGDGIAEPAATQINMASGLYGISFNKTDFGYQIIPITSVGILGTAFPDGWNSDINLTDLGNGVYQIQNLDAIDGEWKIRVNDDWTINWGSTYHDGILNPDGSNIGIAAGNYTFTIDILNKTYSVVITGDLIAHYTYDGDANDQSGNGYNGTVNGATLTNDRYGNANGAYSFNGSDNYINANNLVSYPTGDVEITYMAWVKIASSHTGNIISFGETIDNKRSSFLYEGGSNNLSYIGQNNDFRTSNVPVIGEWTHVAVTKSGSTIIIYIDGTEVGQGTLANSSNITLQDLIIGANPGANNEFFNGDIDEVRIYKKALSASDISTIYADEKPLNTETEITSFSMSEQTAAATIGTGTIDITVAANTDVTALVASFNLSNGAFVTVNGNEQVSGSTSNDFTNPVSYVVTAEDGTSTQSWNVTVSVQSEDFTISTVPSSIDAATGTAFTIDVQDNSVFSNVSFLYRGITNGPAANFITGTTTSNGTVHSFTLNGDEDPLGIEFKFKGDLVSGGSIETSTQFINIDHSGDGIQIPSDRIKFSDSDPLAYRAISIPLNLSSGNSNTIFDELGEYSKNWRLYSFSPSNSSNGGSFQEQSANGTNLQLGKGYFILAKSSASIFTGSGSTPSVTYTEPVEIQISQGWNLIGNPYNFSIDWSEVLAANTDVSNIDQLSNQLSVWLGSYSNSQNYLLSFQGGFVFSAESMSIKIPVTRNTSLPTSGGRISEQDEKDPPAWLVTMNLKENEKDISRLKVGMHKNAELEYDKYDQVTLPALVKTASLKIAHPEFFAPSFSSDIVPIDNYFEWEIELDQFKEGSQYNLSWTIKDFEHTGKSRILFDVLNQKKVNMDKVSNYSFRPVKGQIFKMYFGNLDEINSKLIPSSLNVGDIYPNPATDHLVIPFRIPEIKNKIAVDMALYNLQGEKISTILKDDYETGFQQFNWDIKDSNGNNLPNGIYILFVKMGSITESRKIILR